MKKRAIITISALVFLALMAAPAFAAKPTVNDDVWFVASGMKAPSVLGETWWTGDGTILHMKGEIQPNWGVYRSPPGSPPGSVSIGSMTTMLEEFVFNTEIGKGRLILKVTIAFTETNPTKNPYGVGTLEGTLVAEVTTLFVPMPNLVKYGDGTGFVVATHGTGTFENAKLTADLVMRASAGPPPSFTIFFGTQPNVNGCGIIVYH